MRQIRILIVLGGLLASSIVLARAAELTINDPSRPVHAVDTLGGKAPNKNVRVYVVVNPVEQPQQFWVQEQAAVDSRGNWTCNVHFGDPIARDSGKKFRVKVFADANLNLPVGLTQNGNWPQAKWVSEEITVTRE